MFELGQGSGGRTGVVVATLIALALALILPTAASAATYTVNSVGDQEDKEVGEEGCKTAVNTCTLRAAIEELNESGEVGLIKFSASFNGQAADTIVLTTELPTIEEAVHIDGDNAGQCTTEAAGAKGPCVGISGPAAGSALAVATVEGVEIEGLAVTGAKFGINVFESSETSPFVARDDWLGVKLDGGAGGNQIGILVGPGSEGAVIGGTKAVQRNVFASNSADGLDVLGAESTVVQGNYFGVKPNGATQASNGKDIEVNSTSIFEATRNEIGGVLTAEEAKSAACDGACNVISGAVASGIDLKGDGGQEVPAGETTISNNYVGLNAAGTAAVANAVQGILVGDADEVLIGGGNHINGGTYGILAGTEADGLKIDGNLIGLNPAGTEMLAPPSGDGVFDSSEEVSSEELRAEITGNRIAMTSGVAIEQHSVGALISGNVIGRGLNGQVLGGGTTGVWLHGDPAANLVEANVIENSTGNGVLIQNENNELIGNVIKGAGAAGVRIANFLTLGSTGNVVGGNLKSEENAISGSGGDAVEIADPEDTDNQVLRNFGDGNGGLFIDLGANGPGNGESGPNGGIQPPVIGSAKVTGAGGSGALPGAKVRVFRKATASPGEIASFLGETTADGSGNWSVAYASAIPGETQIAASQTGLEGTSELAFAKTEPAPPSGGGSGGGGGGGAGKDATPPETKILKAPKAKSRATTAKFTFSSSEAGSTFQCSLDGKRFRACTSPKKYKALKRGRHVFMVLAVDAAGNIDSTPAVKKFKIVK